MEYYKTTLLTTNNHKTIKGEKLGYITYIMYLSPHKQNSKGINLCSHASAGCSSAYLFKSGFGGMYNSVQMARKNKTEWFLSNRNEFMLTLVKEISKAVIKHKDKAILTIRLNGTSDIRFEKIKVQDNKNIFELFPDVQFYDYTKNPKRFNELPSNYHLTFSRSETNDIDAMKLLKQGYNVAMVFNKVPTEYNGYKVIVGDETDLRFLDERGVIVGLKYKFNTGKGSEINNRDAFVNGFAINV
jgi:hypothetical protein